MADNKRPPNTADHITVLNMHVPNHVGRLEAGVSLIRPKNLVTVAVRGAIRCIVINDAVDQFVGPKAALYAKCSDGILDILSKESPLLDADGKLTEGFDFKQAADGSDSQFIALLTTAGVNQASFINDLDVQKKILEGLCELCGGCLHGDKELSTRILTVATFLAKWFACIHRVWLTCKEQKYREHAEINIALAGIFDMKAALPTFKKMLEEQPQGFIQTMHAVANLDSDVSLEDPIKSLADLGSKLIAYAERQFFRCAMSTLSESMATIKEGVATLEEILPEPVELGKSLKLVTPEKLEASIRTIVNVTSATADMAKQFQRLTSGFPDKPIGIFLATAQAQVAMMKVMVQLDGATAVRVSVECYEKFSMAKRLVKGMEADIQKLDEFDIEEDEVALKVQGKARKLSLSFVVYAKEAFVARTKNEWKMLEAESKALQEFVFDFEKHLAPMDDMELKALFPDDDEKAEILGEQYKRFNTRLARMIQDWATFSIDGSPSDMAAVMDTETTISKQIAAGILLQGLWSEAEKENAKAIKTALDAFEEEEVPIHESLKARVVEYMNSCGDIAEDKDVSDKSSPEEEEE